MESAPQQAGSNYNEISMQHSLVFTDSLKDLKNLRKQLYSAAEYFESSYGENEHKHIVIETLKDYVSEALVSSVDHLGSVACKLNSFLDEKVDEFSTTKLRFSCMEQKLRSCQEFVDSSGLLQHSLIMLTPKHHKRYMVSGSCLVPSSLVLFQYSVICLATYLQQKNMFCFSFHSHCQSSHFAAAKTQPAAPRHRQRINEHNLCPQDDLQLPKHGDCFPHPFQALPSKPHPSKPKYMKKHSKISWTDSSPNPLNFSFSRVASSKEAGKRSVSPLRLALKRSGSVINRSVSPLIRYGSIDRSVSPSTTNNRVRCPSEPRRAISMSMNPERNSSKDIQQYTRKSKNLLTAFLSLHSHGPRKTSIPSRYCDAR